MDRDHVGGISGICDVRVSRKINVAPSNGTTTEAEAKYGEATFGPEEALFERNASGLGFGKDEVAEVEGFGWDHFAFRRFRSPG